MYKVTTARKHDEVLVPVEEVYVECVEDAIKYLQKRTGRKDYVSFISVVHTY